MFAISRDRAGAGFRAALALLLCLATGLTACSGLAASNEDAAAPAVLDPNYRQIVADRLRSAFKDIASYDEFQIADPRWTHAPLGWTWIICVRFVDHGRMQNYALFMKSSAVIDNRFAVATDGCDTVAYAPFSLMTNGLQPIH